MSDSQIQAVQAAVVKTINMLGSALLGADFKQITASPIPDDEVDRILETTRKELNS